MKEISKHTVLTSGILCAAAMSLAACGGGSDPVTLHGTFTDSADTSSGSACADQGTLSGVTIAVTVDNVSAGGAPVTWTGNPVPVGTFLASGDPVFGCTGTWSVTVPSAHIGSSLTVNGLGGVSGSVTIPIAGAGKPIALNDSTSNDQGGAVLGHGQ